jgi:type IV secretory pathway TrbD component
VTTRRHTFRSAGALAGALAAALTVGPARAQAIDHAAIAHDTRDYYGGELASGYAAAALGTASLAAGGALVTRRSDFAVGVAWPLLTLGALEALGGASYAGQVEEETAHYTGLLARDPSRFRREETAHMRGTTARFFAYRVVEIGLLAAGIAVAAVGFAARRDTAAGAGVGMAIVALPIVVIDTFNDPRARRYLDHVQRFTTF